MNLNSSGDVKTAAKENGVAAERLEDFIRSFHLKTTYMKPEAAFESCMKEEKNAAYAGGFGQIPPRKLHEHL